MATRKSTYIHGTKLVFTGSPPVPARTCLAPGQEKSLVQMQLNYISICFKHPLSHFIILAHYKVKDSPKDFSIKEKLFLLFPIVAPFIPAILAKCRYVPFFI